MTRLPVAVLFIATVHLLSPCAVNAQFARPEQTALDRPAPHAVAIPDSVRRKVGYQHWRGGAIGVLAGAAGGALLGLVGRTRCADCDGKAMVVELSAAFAGLGGAFGFLVGAASPKYQWVRVEEERAGETDPR